MDTNDENIHEPGRAASSWRQPRPLARPQLHAVVRRDLELNGKKKFSLRVPMVDEDSGDPLVGGELHDLELEPAHVAP